MSEQIVVTYKNIVKIKKLPLILFLY